MSAAVIFTSATDSGWFACQDDGEDLQQQFQGKALQNETGPDLFNETGPPLKNET